MPHFPRFQKGPKFRKTVDPTHTFTDEDFSQGQVEKDVLASLTGKWEEIKSRTDKSADDTFLSALGVSWIKRKAMGNYALKVQFTAVDDCYFHVKGFYPLRITKELAIPIDGRQHIVDDGEVGLLDKCHAFVGKGALVQHRVGETGTMVDSRLVFASDPKGEVAGPVQFMKWVWVNAEGTTYMTTTWFSKVDFDPESVLQAGAGSQELDG
ncbi:MAG: uncharacterized protein KVP18_003332 [Porospora cf. gigantea A]|uniref:uncharacterized protein n=1 Tax=Porospora cf. gigantea A TaxID=2853593 RepID=UPI003559ED1F|nr:MAG: hypothetical protein KVP18_003332 [Porospora cf. gigantea A]